MNDPMTCHHCQYTWVPRKKNGPPVKCCRCQNPLWKSSRPKRARGESSSVVERPSGINPDGGSSVRIPASPPLITGSAICYTTEGSTPTYTPFQIDEKKRAVEELMRKLA